MTLRGTGREGCHGRIDAVALTQSLGDLARRRGAEVDGARARSDGGEDILGTRGTQQPHEMGRRLLEHLEQHVGRRWRETVSILDDDDVPGGISGYEERPLDEFLSIVHAIAQRLGPDQIHIGMRAGDRSGADRAGPTTVVRALQRSSEGHRGCGAP